MNNKWYQSAPCKGILIVLEHILAVVMITCLVFTFSYPGDNLAGILFEKPHKKYDQSKGFTDKLMSAANDITAAEGYDSNFETEGKYDENRIVDLKEYDSDRKISNENVNGLAYRLGDLVNYWENDQEMYYADGTKMADGDNDDEIIVCQKDDGTYHYYYEKEFRREFKNGNLQFGNMDEAKDEYSLESTGEVIDSLINDWIESSASIYRNILDLSLIHIYAGKPALEYFDASNSDKYQVDQDGNWSATAANNYMTTNLSQYNEGSNNMIELVICNNDGMAEGAVSALNDKGYNLGTGKDCKMIPVFGVDATDAAKQLIADGKMTATVKQDADGMAACIADLAKNAAGGKDLMDGTDSYNISEKVSNKIFIPYQEYSGK